VVGIGSQIGGYELLGKLGHGGMATLYVARRSGAEAFSRHVAFKVVHPHLVSDERFVRMFKDEARMMARVNHPNVVRVDELGEHEDTHFLVMEYVHGCSLSEFLRELDERRLRMSVDVAVHIAAKVAEGIHAAHETRDEHGEQMGLVHRDISPQNILLAAAGHVKLIDFGVAKARGRLQQTGTLTLKGKVAYMAPEQASARPVDRRVDIYALGIVLWEMLTMRRRFAGTNDFAILDQVRRPTYEPPSRHASGIPHALDEVLESALSADPDGRPATALEFRRRIVDACAGAVALEASDISELLLAVVGDQIRKRHSGLPETVSMVIERESGLLGAGEHQPNRLLDRNRIVKTHTTESTGDGGWHELETRDLPVPEPDPVEPVDHQVAELLGEPTSPRAQRPPDAAETGPTRPLDVAPTSTPIAGILSPDRKLFGVPMQAVVVVAMVALLGLAGSAGAWLAMRGVDESGSHVTVEAVELDAGELDPDTGAVPGMQEPVIPDATPPADEPPVPAAPDQPRTEHRPRVQGTVPAAHTPTEAPSTPVEPGPEAAPPDAGPGSAGRRTPTSMRNGSSQMTTAGDLPFVESLTP